VQKEKEKWERKEEKTRRKSKVWEMGVNRERRKKKRVNENRKGGIKGVFHMLGRVEEE